MDYSTKVTILNSILQKLLEPTHTAINEITDFFGEENVDVQNIITIQKIEKLLPSSLYEEQMDSYIESLNEKLFTDDFNILIHFPHVTVSNERNESVDINHLWVKVYINYRGLLECDGFAINRSEYFESHWESDYMFSHCNGISTQWSVPCLGNRDVSSCPLKSTINYLKEFNEENAWKLFCVELDRYMHTESIEGVPYRYLNKIGKNLTVAAIDKFISIDNPERIVAFIKSIGLLPFIKYILKNGNLQYGYKGYWYLASNFRDFALLLTELFIKYFNEGLYPLDKKSLYKLKILQKVKVDDFTIKYIQTDINSSIDPNETLFKFKGKIIKLKIVKDREGSSLSSYCLNAEIITGIAYIITTIINYYADGNNNKTTEREYFL